MLSSIRIPKGIYPVKDIIQAIFLPLVLIAPVAVILILVFHLEPAAQLTSGILYVCLFISCVFIALWKYKLSGIGLTHSNLRRNLSYAMIILVFSYIFSFIAQPVRGFVSINSDFWWTVLFFLIVAIAEECWFRGLIFTALNEWKGAWVAVIGSAVLFGIMHFPIQGWIGIRHIFYGLPLAVVRFKTGNILGLIITHWLINLADTLIVFSVSDMNMSNVLISAIFYLLGYPGLMFFILYIDSKVSKRE